MEYKNSIYLSLKQSLILIWNFLDSKKYSHLFWTIVIFFMSLTNLIYPLIVGKIVDFFINYTSGDSFSVFIYYSILIGIIWIVTSIIRLSGKKILRGQIIDTMFNVRVKGFENLLKVSLSENSEENSGSKVQKLQTSVLAIEKLSSLMNNNLLGILANLIGIIIVFLYLDWHFFIFLFIYLILFFSIEYFFNKKIIKAQIQQNLAQEKATGKFQESIGNILLIKSMGSRGTLQEHIKHSEENTRKFSLQIRNLNTSKWYSFQILSGIALIIFLFLVGFKVMEGLITIGMIVVYYTYFETLKLSFANLVNLTEELVRSSTQINRIKPVFEIEEASFFTQRSIFPKNWKNLKFENISYQYSSTSKLALNNINFSIKKGEKVAIIGTTGSGKSTILKILLGLYKPKEGNILIGKESIYNLSYENYQKHLSVVLQESELFNISLVENITLMKNMDPLLLKKVIKISNLISVISKLSNGIETEIGEKGYKLSGGERQRIGIARALYKNSSILLFDEGTSALDSNTEKIVLENLLSYLNKKTLIFITHKISTLKYMDKIIILEKGKIVEQGTFIELSKNKKYNFSKLL